MKEKSKKSNARLPRSGLRLLAGILTCLMSVLWVSADEADVSRVATEYMSEGLYEPFESEETLPTAATPQGLTVSASAAVLMDVTTGKILFSKNPDEERPPASITKIMTLLLTMEAIENGRLMLTDTVTADTHACSMGGSQIWLKEGEQMTVDDLLKAVCVASANDAAVALGEHLAGSEEAFVMQMNERAAALGMTHTHFVNCCGLDADGHYTTAKDVAIMSRELLRHELITRYTTLWTESLRGGATQLVNTNKMVRFYKGTTGLKTGTTSKAGYCVAASARQGDLHLLAVILNGETSNKRFSDAKALLNYGFAGYALAFPDPGTVTLPRVTVTRGTKESVDLVAGGIGPFLVKKGTADRLAAEVRASQTVEAPVSAGQQLGKVIYTVDGEKVGEAPLTARTPVKRRTFGQAFWMWLCCLTA